MGLRFLRWSFVFGFGRLVCVCGFCSSPSQNEANIDDTFVQKSTENQVGFGMVLVDTEVVLDCSWGLKGVQEGPFLGSWGTLGRPFGVLGWPWAPILGFWGYPWTRSARSRFKRPAILFPRRLVLSDFGAQSEPQRVPKLS